MIRSKARAASSHCSDPCAAVPAAKSSSSLSSLSSRSPVICCGSKTRVPVRWGAVVAQPLPSATLRHSTPSAPLHLLLLPSCITTATAAGRSEEHTSELQSRENLVCRLLLEKKKIYTKV